MANYAIEEIEDEEQASPQSKYKIEEVEPEKKGLQDFFSHVIRESSKRFLAQALGDTFGKIAKPIGDVAYKAGYGAIPALEQLPTGIKEGAQSAYAGLTGGEFTPSETPDEYGAGFGRGAGKLLGQGAVAAPIGALVASGAGAVGVPALLAGLGGTALGFGATTPGTLFDRSVAGGEAAALHGLGSLLKYAISGKMPIKEVVERAKNIFEVPKFRRAAEEAEGNVESGDLAHEQEQNQFQALKDFYEQHPEFKTSNPNLLQRQASEKQLQSEQLQKEVAETPEQYQVEEQPQAPELTDIDKIEPPKAEEIDLAQLPKTPVNEETVQQAESLLKTHEQKMAELEEAKSTHLKKGYEHGVPIAEAVVNKIEGVKNPKTGKRTGGVKQEIGSQYDAIEQSLGDDHIEVPRTKELTSAEDEVRKTLEKSRGFFKNDEEFEKAVQKISKEGQTQGLETPQGRDLAPAKDVLSNYRTVRNLAQKMRSKAYSREVAGNKDLQADILGKAEELEGQAKQLEKILEDNDLGGHLEDLRAANSRWREEIVPLYKNNVYQTFLNKGYSPTKDLIYSLRGKGSGQEIIRNIIKEDPELLKNIVGQRYANNPTKLHEFDELSQEYIEKMPELQNLRNQHFEATQNAAKAKINVEKAKNDMQVQKEKAAEQDRAALEQAKQQNRQARESAKTQHKATKAEAKAKNKAAEEEHVKKTANYQAKQKIKELDAAVIRFKEAAQQAEKASNAHGLSLKNKIQLKEKAKQAKAKYEKARADRNKAAIGVGAATGVIGGGGIAHKQGVL